MMKGAQVSVRACAIAGALLGVVGLGLWAQARLHTDAERRTLQVGGREREYLLHAPGGLPRDRPAPLVFVFHGGNGEAKGAMNLSRFNALAERDQFLVVYPQGIGRSWNDGRVTQVSQAHRENIDDLAFFDALLRELSRDYRVDAERVFATGISNGGIFAHYLAAQRAEQIAAIAPIVGGIAEPFHHKFRPAAPVSVLIIQGGDDPLVPYQGGKIDGGDGKDRGSVLGAEESAQLWVKANGRQAEPEQRLLPDRDPRDGCRVAATLWKGGRQGSEVWLYRVEGGGHTWPGGIQYLPRAFIGRVTHDIDSQTIWDFFRTHPKSR